MRQAIWAAGISLAFCASAAVPALAETAGEAVQAQEQQTVTYPRGSYIVGVDLPAGEYAVFSDSQDPANPYSTCSFTLYKNDLDEKQIGTFSFQHHGLVTLYNGQHLVISRGYAVPAEESTLPLAPYGMYKAGRDMEAGTYRITPLTSQGGHYALYNDVRYYYDYQDGYSRFYGPVEITVEEGQYLELGDAASIVKV